jgi:hypothetical protein
VVLAYIEQSAQEAPQDGAEGGTVLPSGRYLSPHRRARPCFKPMRLRPRSLRQRPQLRIVSRANEDISSDALPIVGFEHYEGMDYRLDYVTGDEPLFYVVSPKDVVVRACTARRGAGTASHAGGQVARPRDADDRISWLLARCVSRRGPPRRPI